MAIEDYLNNGDSNVSWMTSVELRRGAKGPQVGILQSKLNGYYGYNLAIDNDFGPKTEAAVKDFQSKYNAAKRTSAIRTDGIVDSKVWAAIEDRSTLIPSVPKQPGAGVLPSTGSDAIAQTGQPATPQPNFFQKIFAGRPLWQNALIVGGGIAATLFAVYALSTPKSASFAGFLEFLGGDPPKRKTCGRCPSNDKLDDAEEMLPSEE